MTETDVDRLPRAREPLAGSLCTSRTDAPHRTRLQDRWQLTSQVLTRGTHLAWTKRFAILRTKTTATHVGFPYLSKERGFRGMNGSGRSRSVGLSRVQMSSRSPASGQM